jgi:hypothetical protein
VALAHLVSLGLLAAADGGAMTTSDIRFGRAEVAAYYRVRAPRIRQTSHREWRGPCPIHQGKRDSFAIRADSGLWHCHSQCDRGGDILAFEQAITGADFAEARAEVFHIVGRIEPERSHFRIVAEYNYTDERGDLLYQVVRLDPKDFRQRRPDGRGGWIWKKSERQVLYRLPEVLQAPIVFLVEGERDAETLREFGFVATTNAGGAKAAWLDSYTAALTGREVIVIPDRDADGRQWAAKVIRALTGHASKLIVLEVDDGCKDISDWFARGHSELELIAHIEADGVSQ